MRDRGHNINLNQIIYSHTFGHAYKRHSHIWISPLLVWRMDVRNTPGAALNVVCPFLITSSRYSCRKKYTFFILKMANKVE